MPASSPVLRVLTLTCCLTVPTSASADADAADSLATPITMDARDELWPVELSVAIVEPHRRDPLPPRTLVVPDGHRMSFDNVVRTPTGERRFEFQVIPHHHPGKVVELEWKLLVSEARYQLEPGVDGWRTYLLHRVGLGPRPPLGPSTLRVVRADIVTSRGDRVAQPVDLGAERYQIVLSARRSQG